MEKTSEKEANKSVRFSRDTDRKFSQIAEKLGRSKQDVFAQMVDYFYKSKKDPSDLSDEVLKKELSKGISRIQNDITELEEEHLTLILEEVRSHKLSFEAAQTTEAGKWQDNFQQWEAFMNQFKRMYLYDEGTKQVTGSLALVYNKANNTNSELVKVLALLTEIKTQVAATQSSVSTGSENVTTHITSEINKLVLSKDATEKRVRAIKNAYDELLQSYMEKRDQYNSITNSKSIEQLKADTLRDASRIFNLL